MDYYESTHESVTFELEVLPESGEERQSALEQLRVEIMSGNGPDLYLLPAGYMAPSGESLFSDVAQSMYSGLFMDISAYYNADDALQTEELSSPIMDAGTVGDKRYVLPLRYAFPVIYAGKASLEASGLDLETLSENAGDLFDAVLEKGSPVWSFSALPAAYPSLLLNLLPNLYDYSTGKVLLEQS